MVVQGPKWPVLKENRSFASDPPCFPGGSFRGTFQDVPVQGPPKSEDASVPKNGSTLSIVPGSWNFLKKCAPAHKKIPLKKTSRLEAFVFWLQEWSKPRTLGRRQLTDYKQNGQPCGGAPVSSMHIPQLSSVQPHPLGHQGGLALYQGLCEACCQRAAGISNV